MLLRHSSILSLLVCVAKLAAADNGFPSTTTTTTSVVATQVSTTTDTVTNTEQAPDATTTNTGISTTTLATQTVDTTTTLAPITTTSTAPQATKTVVNKNCIDYHVRFGKNCCPRSYCRPPPKKYHHYIRSADDDDDDDDSLDPFEREAREMARLAAQGATVQKRQNANSTPCSQSSFVSFNTGPVGQSVDLFTNYNFVGASVLRVQDLYAVNVCGDIYLDGTYLASTNCPALNGGDTSDYEDDPDAAIASGNFAYAYVNIPAGTHTVSFVETYSGGAAYWQLSSQQQCELDISTLTVGSTTTTSTQDILTTTTLAPTSTDTIQTTTTATITPAPETDTATITPAPATTTLVPAPAKVKKCKQVYIDISCPRMHSSKMVRDWGYNHLKNYKQKTYGDLGVQCGAEFFIF